MTDINAFVEKRQFERVASRIRVSYKIISESELDKLAGAGSYQDIASAAGRDLKVKDVMTVVTENISVGGLMIVGDQPINAGASMQLEMSLPQTPLPLKCLAVVVRGSGPPKDGKYSAGLRFLAINKDDVAKIQRYIVLQKRANPPAGA